MLLPDNIHPELSIYYNGSIVLAELNEESKLQIMDLYQRVKERNGMSFPIFILSLDWLYLINVAQVNSEGVVELCL
jgi:hypothetical protein